MLTMQVDANRALAKISGLQTALPEKMGRVVTALTLKLLAAVQARAPVRTGKLRRSIFQDVTISQDQAIGRVYVSPDTLYAKFMEYGTKPHDIYPTKAQALHFMVGDKEVFAKVVHHPGTKPYLYVHGPFEEMKPEIIAKIEATAIEALK